MKAHPTRATTVLQNNYFAGLSIEISSLRIVIDPIPIEEYDILDKVRKYLSDKLDFFKKFRDIVAELSKKLPYENVNIIVELRAGIPIRILIKS